MAVTRDFKELVQKRIARDPAFGDVLLREGIDTRAACGGAGVITMPEKQGQPLRPSMCKARLEADGWCAFSSRYSDTNSLAAEIAGLAMELGQIVPGRGRQHVERILPKDTDTAHNGSLSQRYGLAPLPLHTDTAHWTIPCRYLIMACAEPGPEPTPTILLDSKVVSFSESEATGCASAVFLIRNGRHSFYGSIIARDRSFIRLDRGCMVPLSSDGAATIDMFSLDRNAEKSYRHGWNRGDVLVIDNWRMLHGRGIDRPTKHGRELLRVMVR